MAKPSTPKATTKKSSATVVPIEPFPKLYNWLILSPLLAIILGSLANRFGVTSLLGVVPLIIIAFVPAGILYWYQSRYIHTYYPGRKMRYKVYLVLAAILLPAAAEAFGDEKGAADYGTPLSGLHTDIIGGLYAGVVVAIFFMFWFILGNMLFIKNKGVRSSSGGVTTISYYIGWIIVVASSYVIYSLEYSSHDPSTE